MGKKGKKYKKQERTEEEILELSFENLSDGFHKEIISLFHHISAPFDDGKGEKEKRMMKLLTPYGAVYEEDLGIRVPAIEKAEFVVVSHMDLIPSFNKGFKEGKVYSLGILNEKEIISGALDNTFTNSVVMHAIFSLREKGLAKNVEFIFTEAEETTSMGMKTYLKKYGNKPFFINLDVTNDGQGSHMSIEYDEPNWSICRQINNKFNAAFTTDRVGDDMDAIIDAKGKGYSYCIPTWKTIHSYKNYTLIENIVPYFEGLLWMITEMDISNVEHDFTYLSMKKALTIETQEKLLKKEEKAKKKRKTNSWYGNKGYYGSTTSIYNKSIWDDDESMNDFEVVEKFAPGQAYFDYGSGLMSESEYLEQFEGNYDSLELVSHDDISNLEEVVNVALESLRELNITSTPEIEKFINQKVWSQDQFVIEDLIKETDLSLEEAMNLIELLDDYYCLEIIEPGVYQFSSKCKVKVV